MSERESAAVENPLPIIKPCEQSWDGMKGDERRRFCEKCGLHVHNLSAMSQRERDRFVQTRAVKDCVAYAAAGRDRILVPRERPRVFTVLRRALTWTMALCAPVLAMGCLGRRSDGEAVHATPPPEIVSADQREAPVTAGIPLPPPPTPTPNKPKTS